MTREDEELTSRLRWLAQVRICETKIVDCHNCEFHGTCTDPDSDESIAEQIAIHTESAAAIERLSARVAELEEAQRWIPCGERLPGKDDKGPYFECWTVENKRRIMAVSASGGWCAPSKDWFDCYDKKYVTHWQALPKPPEEGGKK